MEGGLLAGKGLLFLLQEGVGDLLTAVGGGDEDNEGATGDDEAEGAGSFVALVIWTG